MHTRSIAVVNVSVCVFPPALLPGVYSYGYATPFYNVQQAVRTIVFGTRDQCALPSCLRTFLFLTEMVSTFGSGTQLWSTDRLDSRLVVHTGFIPVHQTASGGSCTRDR